jgi:hypothetical protein
MDYGASTIPENDGRVDHGDVVPASTPRSTGAHAPADHWVPDPVLGDTNYEHEFTNDSYADAGGGVRFPTVWHHHEEQRQLRRKA